MKKLIYIAGALNSDAVGYIKNFHNMLVMAESVRREGFAVFVPALDFMMGVMWGDYEYADYFDNSQPILDRCDAVFVVPGWENSSGTKKEISSAIMQNIPVFFELAHLREWRDCPDKFGGK